MLLSLMIRASNAPAELRALSEKQASRQLQPVVGRHFISRLAAKIGEIRFATNTRIQILPCPTS